MRTATLIEPYLGYRNIILIEKWDTKWEVEICGNCAYCLIIFTQGKFKTI